MPRRDSSRAGPQASRSIMEYKEAGVDIDAGNETVRRIRSLAKGTFTPGVLSDIGSFGGLFRLVRDRYQDPVLVSSADGVGTKLKVAFMMDKHDTVGADLVNHCVNDILVQGAEPLFFLDYLATGRLSPAVAEQVITGVARACKENGCALIGGETAEMPGFYADGEYDIAGFIVGAVDKAKVIDGRTVVPGDVLIAIPSAGLHTNGYSLARRVLFDVAGMKADTFVRELGTTVGEAVAGPHRSYPRRVRARPDERRGAAGAPPLLSAAGASAARARLGERPGPHHRRRPDRESAADAAAGLRRGPRSAVGDHPAALPAAAAARRHRRRRDVPRLQHGRRHG